MKDRQCFRMCRIRQRLTDIDVLDSGDGHDISGPGLVALDPLQSLEAEQLLNPRLLHLAFAVDDGDSLALADAAPVHAADRNPAHIFIVVKQGNEELKRLLRVLRRRRDMIHDRVI